VQVQRLVFHAATTSVASRATAANHRAYEPIGDTLIRMRPLQLLIAALLGACIVLLVLLAIAKPRECATELEPSAMPVRFVDTGCYSCGSGSGPTAMSLSSLVELADDEVVVALDRQPTPPTKWIALADLIDAFYGRMRTHGQTMDFTIASGRGQRRVVLVLH